MALGAKLIAATLILGASTVGTYAIANGGLGGLSSEGDSSTSTEETGTQKAVEAPAGAGEAGVRAEPAPNAAVVPQDQPQPAQASIPDGQKNEAAVDNQGGKGEEVEGAGDTAVTPRDGSPAPEGGNPVHEPKGDVQGQSSKVVSNVEAEVASDTEHSSNGVTVQQQPPGGQGSNLEGASLTAEPAAGEEQHRSAGADGGIQSNPVTDQSNNNVDPNKAEKSDVEVAQVPGNTDPNKDTSGERGAEPQDKGTSSQLETTSTEISASDAPQNPENNRQGEISSGSQDNHNTPGN